MLHTVAAFMVLLFLATGAVAAVQVRVTPASASATVGSTVTVTVEADSVADLGGFQFGFAYSATDVQAVSATVNPAFDLVVANDPGAASGSGMIAAAVFNNPPLSGAPVTLATLEFKLLTPVTGTINLVNVILGQVGGAEIPSTAVGGSIAGSTFSKANQTIGTIGFSPAILTVGGATTVNASASSALAVSFSSKTPTICTVSGNTVTGISSGTCTITADQAGDGNYNAATQVTQDIAITPAVCTPPVSGLISWWKGNGDANDSYGSNNGTLMNGATFAPGKVGQAFSFDGTNQYVVTPDSPSLDLSSQFTLQAWINPLSVPHDAAIISKVGGAGGNNGYQFGISPSLVPGCQFNASGEPWSANAVNGGTTPLNVWSHIACTYDNDNLRVYVNGVLVGSSTIGPKNVVNSSSTLRISGDDNDHVYFTGRIDEPQIYNRALSAAEIAAIYYAGSSGVCATIPGAPTISSVAAGNVQATVNFTEPVSNGGSAITGYTVTATPGGLYATGTTSPITVTGLTNGTAYTFTVTAANAVGTGAASNPSITVIPVAPVNGACGGSNGQVFSIVPTTSLCTAGTATTVTGSGPWSWSCEGSNSGTTAVCGATRLAQEITTKLPRTGQTSCYDVAGNTITCTGTGEDGDLQTGEVWPTPRFTVIDDLSITDRLTGLVWSKDATGPGPSVCNPGTIKVWQGALDYVNCLNSTSYQGKSDWRLPTLNELKSLVNLGQTSTADWLNTQGFMNAQSYRYWSSTSFAADTGFAWYVDLSDGRPSWERKSGGFSVWPVRAGQNGVVSVLKTGQTTVYSAGDDGELQNGAASPAPRFTPVSSASGTVIADQLTGLTWTQNGAPPGGVLAWQDALYYIAELNINNYLGYNDWRLPNLGELSSLLNQGQTNSMDWLNTQGFTNAWAGSYWSSTTYSGYVSDAWFVHMNDGQVWHVSKDGNFSVWPVRGGLSGNIGVLTPQTIGSISFSPANLAVGGASAISATATSGLAVSFNSTTPDVCTVNGATVSGVSAGTCTVTADQAGNANYVAALPATRDITVAKASQAIGTISILPSTLAVNGSSTINATGGASGTAVTFGTTTGAICNVSGNSVTGLAAGICTITADQAGDGNYNAATQVTQDITIAPAVCTRPVSGLISWWKGNGNANDSYGSNNGTLINGATFAPGKVGQAFSFDGVNQFVSITDSPSLRPKDLTIETWVKFSSVPSMAIIAAKTLGSVYGDSFFLDLEYGKLNGGVGDNSGFGEIVSYPFIPELNAWYHLTYTFDDSTKTQALYINGQQVATGTQATSIAYDSHPVLIGADINSESPGYYFPGSVDEVKVYNRSLSVDEIAAIYNAGSAGVCAATVPGAPASVTASAGNSQATVNFTEPASNGGSVITGYTVTATPGGITATGATSPITVTGLTNGTSYTFTVTATNSVGSGAASVASSPVTPISDGTYYSRNLVVNGDAESVPAANTTVTLFPGWATDGNVSILGYNSSGGWPSFTDPGPENRGNNFFYGGSVGTSAASQEIDISFASNDIDAGNARFDVSAWIGGYSSQGDMAVVRVAFYGAGSQLLGTSTIGPVLYTDRASMTGLLYRAASGIVPANARRATISMEFTRIDGSANDGYLDNVSFMLAPVGSPTTQKSSQTIGAISFLPGTLTVGATTTVSAAATSGLPVGFNSSTPGVCTVNGTIVSGVSVGTCTVNADQSGNATYSAAPEVTQNIAVLANPVNGVCGTSNGVTFIAAPTTNFCTSGTATAVSGSGPWNWSCNGSNGGSTASCSAGIQSYTVSFVSGGNGTLSGTNSQTVNYGGSATTVTALSAIGFHFVNWTEGALVAGSTSVLTVTNVTAAHTFVANFAADPFGGICGSSNGSTFRIAPATNLCSTGSATTVSGSGPWNWSCIGSNGGTTATCSAAVDITGPAVVVSTLADGAITNNATLNVSGTVSDASGVAGLTVNNAAVPVTDGSFSYAVVLQAGSNTVVTIATDTVGNSTTDSRIITLDDVAPALTVSAPADNSKSAQGVTTVTGTVNETATVTVSVNSGTPQSASLTGNAYSATVNLAAGLNSIAITATDLAGNKTSAARTVTYDNTKPSLAITTPGQDITTAQNSITISGTVSDTITSATVVITYNGESYSPAIMSGVFSQQLTIPTEGIYTITATATDEAGNSSSVTRNVIYAIPVNGACGTSNGGTFSVVPTTYLCSAGSASDVTGSGPWSWTCSGSDGGTVANCSADKLIIVPVNQLISFGTAPTLTYGGANGAVSASATSGLPVTFSSLTGDICTVSSSTVSPRSAGTCIIAANQGGNGNYNAAAQVTQTIVIAKAVPVITWDTPADIFSGTPLSAAQLNATASVPGDFSYNPASGTILNAGAGQTLSASFIPKDTGNYTGQSASVTLSVIYVDTVVPVISAFTVPATAATLSAVEIAVTATDNVGVIGYLVTESATVPVASDTGWTVAAPTSHTFATWGNHTLSAYAKDAAGNVSALASRRVYIGENPAIDGVIVPESSGSPKYEPALTDALKSLNFAMKVEQPNPTQLLHGRVAPLVNGVPQPDPNRSEFNLGDTVVILRRVIGLQ